MVQIGITQSPFCTSDLCIIELQGSLIIRDIDPELAKLNQKVPAQQFADKYFGDIHYLKEKGKCVLICGHHHLTGEENTLRKPFAVLRRIDAGQYEVTNIIRRKLVFSKRPQPIIIEVENGSR